MEPPKRGTRGFAALRTRRVVASGLSVLPVLLLFACAHRQALVNVNAEQGRAVIILKASNFKFSPNNLRVRLGDKLELRIENISGANHNFTLKNPRGEVIRDVELPAHEMVLVPVDFPEEGTYEFHCNKPFHAGFGMKGWIQVTN
jgi:uncharacterized cupredoxin-like copper-binding protein